MPRAGPSGAVFRRQCARGQNIRSPAPEPVQPYRSDRPCRRVGTLPKLCQIDACTVHDRRAQATPVPPTRRAMRLSGIDFAARFNPRLPGGKATPHRRYAPFQSTPSGGKATAPEPARSPYRARAGPLARVVARAPQDVHAHRHGPRRRFAPDSAQNAPEATRSPQRARSRADASQKPAPRARRSAGARRGARTDRRTSPRQRYAPALRAVSIHAFREEGDRARSRQKPAPRARRPLARVVARAPTGVPARDSVTRRRFTPGTRQTPAASAYRALLRFSTITDPVRIRLRRPGIA
jgi:hypothetical protein